jgi:hypothetical protein
LDGRHSAARDSRSYMESKRVGGEARKFLYFAHWKYAGILYPKNNGTNKLRRTMKTKR